MPKTLEIGSDAGGTEHVGPRYAMPPQGVSKAQAKGQQCVSLGMVNFAKELEVGR